MDCTAVPNWISFLLAITKSHLFRKLLHILEDSLRRKLVSSTFRFSMSMVTPSPSGTVRGTGNTKPISLPNCPTSDTSITSLSTSARGKKSPIVIKNSKTKKTKPNSYRIWNKKKKKNFNNWWRRRRNWMPKCIFLIISRRIWLKLMILRRYWRWEDLKNKWAILPIKSKSWLMPCKRGSRMRMRRNYRKSRYHLCYLEIWAEIIGEGEVGIKTCTWSNSQFLERLQDILENIWKQVHQQKLEGIGR